MKYYFKVQEKIKKYPGIPRTTLPTSIDKDIKQAVKKNHPIVLPVKQFLSTKNLKDLRMLCYHKKEMCEDFSSVIFSA